MKNNLEAKDAKASGGGDKAGAKKKVPSHIALVMIGDENTLMK